jgi:hypothetical protein
MVKDKINYRALGPRTMLTRQTVQGRANDGGLRIGEMERDGLIAHGITNFLQESMLVRGDDYYMAVCNKTGTVAVYNESQNLFFSPLADGPIKFNGALSGDNMKIQTLSKYGRSFSIVRVPYAFKLLMQELATMNVQMRLITEANIDQMTNLSFSDNLQRLTGKVNVLGLKDLLPKATAADRAAAKKNLAALGFTKLPPPPFKKWLISALEPLKMEDLTPLPTAGYDEFVNLEPAQENSWFDLRSKLDDAKNKLYEIPTNAFVNLTSQLDMYATLRTVVQKMYNMEHATNAALKMYEIITQMELLMPNGKCLPVVNAFCNAELPGAFLIAINHFMRTKCMSSDFDWLASSFLPAQQAQQVPQDKGVLEDRYNLYEKNRAHWLMGPAPNGLPEGEGPINGDITDPQIINILGNATHQRFSASDGANLYTGDVGIKLTQADMHRQEDLTAFVNYGQILSGLLALAIGGNLVTKQFTFFTPFNRSLIALIATLFDETYITKPKTSKPTSSEVYLVAKGFKGISSELSTALLDRAEAYKTLDKFPTHWGSLLQPNILSQVDADILAAAQELYGEQQVSFINEVAEAFRIKNFTNTYENSAQEAWLKENPLLSISKDENLNNSVISVEEQAQQTQAQQTQAQQTQAQAVQAEQFPTQAQQQMQQQQQFQTTPELEEESILIPEEDEDEDEKKEDEEDKEGGDKSSGGEKKTISFNFK